MNILFKLLLIVGVSFYLVSTALAIEYFDINKPGIEKLNLSIKTTNSTETVALLVEKLRIQMRKTLLFNVLEDSENATFILEINPTTDDKIVSVNLTGAQGSSFEKISTGMKLRNQDDDHVDLKSSQLGNFLIKNLMGIKGALGSIVIWSESKKGESRNALVMKRFGSESQQNVTYNLFNNTGASWNPNGDAIIYSAQTGRGSDILWQGFTPLRFKSKSVYFDKGKGSSASWGVNGKLYLAKYMGDKNTDIFEYSLTQSASGPQLGKGINLTNHRAIETEAVLSPDGSKLAYISDRTGSPQVYLMDMKTKKSKRLTQKGKYNTSPAWSPDSSMIAYTSAGSGKSSVYRVAADDPLGVANQVSPNGIHAESPVWSSDGSMVAFQAKKGPDWKIYYVLSSGSTAQRLTDSVVGVNETVPSWNSGLN
jgi:Tol biopolymer transport system component